MMNRGNQSEGNLNLDQIEEKIEQLTGEWDIERILELTAIGVSLVSLMLSSTKSKKLLFGATAIATLLGARSLQEWTPPEGFLQHLGFRRRDDIRAEIDDLKSMRGDRSEKKVRKNIEAEA